MEKERRKGKDKKLLTIPGVLSIIIPTRKSIDEDSKAYWKGTASRGGCKPGASRVCLNITSELRFPKGMYLRMHGNLVGADGVPPLQGWHMMVCLGGL